MKTSAKNPYSEAHRYLENARGLLQKAGRENGFYRDQKYIRLAGDAAWKAVLIAVEHWLTKKGVVRQKANRPDVDWYSAEISKINHKLNTYFHSAYHILHMSMGYDGVQNKTVIHEGMNQAVEIIARCEGDS